MKHYPHKKTIVDEHTQYLEDELRKREAEITLLKETAEAISSQLDLDTVFQIVADRARELIQAETLLIPVLDEECQEYTYKAGCGKNAEEIVGESLPIDYGICGWVWRTKRAWWRGVLDELDEEEKNKWEKEAGSVILVPLLGKNHFLGGIAGITKIGGGDFDKRDLDLLSLFASQVTVTIENATLFEQLQQTNQSLQDRIAERQLVETELFEEKERIQTTLSSIGDAVITSGTDGVINYINPATENLLGITADYIIGKQLEEVVDIVDEYTRKTVESPIEICLLGGKEVNHDEHHVLICQDGREVFIEEVVTPIRSKNREIIGVILVLHNVTQSREFAKKISYQASHDELTNLINRREFEKMLKIALQSARLEEVEHILLYLDLDQFKVVNDTCGHVAGDELLKQLTARLNEKKRKNDTLARLGGDEFGMLLERCPYDQALQVANHIRETIQDFRFVWEDKSFAISVSIGLVAINKHSESIKNILSMVDAACYAAKDSGRNRIHTYHAGDNAFHRQQGEMQWVSKLTKAMEEDRMELYCQEIITTTQEPSQGSGSHYEILVRMRGDGGVIIPPGAFLPAAERYNLITTLDRWVVKTIFAWLSEHAYYVDHVNMCSINLSGHSMGDENFLEFIHTQLDKLEFPAGRICFEITETEAIANLTTAVHFIDSIKSRGCLFALDDFGSGFSSYAYLKNLPVDFLKIDGVFIKDLADDPVSYAMVESINQIGHVMGKKTIAEFVETSQVLDILKELGVDYAQGFGISRPVPLDSILG